MWSRRSGLAIAIVLAAGIWGAPASAHHASGHECTGDAETRGGSGEAAAECATDAGGSGVAARECDPDSLEVAYYDDPPPDAPEREWVWARIELRDPSPEGMRHAAAYNCDGMYLGGPHLVLAPSPAWAAAEAARDAARAQLTPPMPDPQVSPAQAVVRLPTWLWVDDEGWQPTSASASEGEVAVRVEARPVRATWELVEGTRVCEGPGIAWSPQAQAAYEAQPAETRGRGDPACTYTFRHSSSVMAGGVYEASVTVSWEFAWWLNGEAQGVFGAIERTTSFELRVGEVQGLVTGYDHEEEGEGR